MSLSTDFEFNATPRTESGKTAARRLRRENKVPAIIYGAGQKPESITLDQNAVIKKLELEAVYSHILTIKIGDKSEKAVLKSLERHHIKNQIMHMDFLRVKAGEKITMRVPPHFTGEELCPGVQNGGIALHMITDIEVKCLPDKLPEFIAVDISKLELDHSIHLSDLVLPKGLELATEVTEEHNTTIISVRRPRTGGDETVEEEKTETPAVDAKSEKAPKADK